jgi:hypothetical protein
MILVRLAEMKSLIDAGEGGRNGREFDESLQVEFSSFDFDGL